MRHAELVVHNQQTMKKGLSLKVERVVDVILWPIEAVVVCSEHIAKNVSRPDMLYFLPYRCKYAFQFCVADKSLPVLIVVVDVLLEILGTSSTIVTPRVTTEEFVATTARQHDLHEFPCKLGRVVIGIALANSRLFQMPSHRRKTPLHVSGLEDHFVMFGAKLRRHGFGLLAFIEGQLHAGGRTQVKSNGEGFEVRN